MWPLDFPEFDPLKLLTEYERHPSDEVFRDIAFAGSGAGRELSLRVNRRCRWLYGSLVGFPLVVAGLMLIWVDGISI